MQKNIELELRLEISQEMRQRNVNCEQCREVYLSKTGWE